MAVVEIGELKVTRRRQLCVEEKKRKKESASVTENMNFL